MLNNLLLLPFRWLLYGLSFCIIRKKNLWAFGSRNGQFVDNPKYFFLHVTKHEPEINAIWISTDKEVVQYLNQHGFNAYLRWSLKGLLVRLRAENYIYAFDSNDISFFSSGNTKLINLYHGIPLKKIEFDTTVGSSRNVYNPSSLIESIRSKLIYPAKWQSIDLFQIPSSSLESIHESAFNHLIKNYFIGANPRLAPLIDSINLHPIIHQDKKVAEELIVGYDQVWIYMPTWRVGESDILNDAFPDLEKLNDTLTEQNILLIFKMHLYSNDAIKAFSHIKLFPNELDVYPFLSVVDVLITDYSSIAFDFSINTKSIIFYAYDLDEYLATSSNGFYFDYNDFCNNTIVRDFEELITVINDNKLEKFRLGDDISSALWHAPTQFSIYDVNKRLVKAIQCL